MRNLFLAIPFVLLGALAGCVWPPDSTELPQFYPPYVSYDIHRISQRSLAGVESTNTIVSPYVSGYYTYPDSLQYILVNGDTAFRHPSITSAPVLDSAAPYRFDGSANVVVMVFPSASVFDTSFISDATDQITSPPYGDTIKRTSDALFSYQYNASFYSGYFQITDSVTYYSQPIESYYEPVEFPVNEVELLRPGTLWADAHMEGSAQSANSNYNYVENRSVELDRIVAYTLQ